MSGFEAQWQAEEMFAMACMIMGVLTALPDRFAAAGRWGGRHPPPPPPPYFHHAHAHHHGAGDVVQSPQAFAAAAVLHHLSGGRLKQPPGPQQHLPPHHNPQRGTFPVPRQGVLDVRMVPTTPSAVAQTAQTLLCKHNANNNTSKHQNNVSSNNNNNNKTNCAPTTQKNKKAQQQPRRILSTPLTASPPTAAATAVATPVTSEKASTATNSSSGTYNGRRNPRKRYKKRPAAEIASTTEGSVRDENENRTPSTATTVADVIGDDAVEAQSRVEVVPTTCTPEIQGVVVESSEVNTREDCGEGAEGVEQGSVTSPATRTTTPQKEEREGEAEAEEETEADENRCDPDHCAKQKEEDVIAEESPDKKNDDDDDTAPILAHASSTTTTSHLLSPAMDDNLLCATTATTATSSTMPSSQQSEQLEDNDETAVDMEENNNNNDDADDYGEEEEADADPNAVRISYRNCDYELSGEWSTIRVHTLKRQLAAVLGLRSNDIVLVVDGDAVEDDLAVASELGIGSGADVAVRGVDDETPLCASPPLPPRTHMDSSQTPLSSQCMCPDCVAYYSYWGTMSPPFDAQPQAPPQHHDIPPTPCNASLCFCDACVGAVAAATPSVAHELDSAAAPQPPATLVLPGPVPSGSPTHSECADVMSTSFASSCAPHAQTQTSSSSLLRRRRSSHSSAASSLSSPLLNGDVRGSNSNLLQHSGSGTQQQQQQVPQQVASSSSFRSVPSTTSQSTAVGLAPSASQKWRFDPYNTDGYIVLQQ